ncbi:MAG: hypothetical protein ABJ000_14200 [Saccharospirillum sp.]|uniref:hypothetical protein n=1 Tax=Saccharospirillum TaxID=231683 RepID=UPI000FDA7DF8|nr:hypothetical protein [Saccharospirillum alexandrii]
MSLGTWTPDNTAPQPPARDTLIQAATLGQADAEFFPAQTPDALSELQGWMKQPQSQWQPELEPLETETLIALVRFFTLAEQHWAGWEAGDKNPAIWICKTLKPRGAFPDVELTRWVKAHTDNRFLPYGNPLA